MLYLTFITLLRRKIFLTCLTFLDALNLFVDFAENVGDASVTATDVTRNLTNAGQYIIASNFMVYIFPLETFYSSLRVRRTFIRTFLN